MNNTTDAVSRVLYSEPVVTISNGDLFKRYRSKVAAWARFIVDSSGICTSDAAEDVVSDVFLKVAEAPAMLEKVRDVEAWLYTLTRRTALDLVRKRFLRKKLGVCD